jgi:hypothetical protein
MVPSDHYTGQEVVERSISLRERYSIDSVQKEFIVYRSTRYYCCISSTYLDYIIVNLMYNAYSIPYYIELYGYLLL